MEPSNRSDEADSFPERDGVDRARVRPAVVVSDHQIARQLLKWVNGSTAAIAGRKPEYPFGEENLPEKSLGSAEFSVSHSLTRTFPAARRSSANTILTVSERLLLSFGASRPAVEWAVAFSYPNGRVHETTIDAPADFGPGYEFNAFGRRWRVADRPRGSRRSAERTQIDRFVCRYIGTQSEGLTANLGVALERTKQR